MNIQGWFPLGWTGWISLLSKGLSKVFSSTTIWKHQFFSAQASLWSNSHILNDYWKNHSFDYISDVSAFNTLSRFVIGLLPRNKYVLISWLQSLSAVILEHVFFRVFKIDKILWKSKTGRCHLRRSSNWKRFSSVKTENMCMWQEN